MQKLIVKAVGRRIRTLRALGRNPHEVIDRRRALRALFRDGRRDDAELQAIVETLCRVELSESQRIQAAEVLFLHGRFEDALNLLRAGVSVACAMMEGWLLMFLGRHDRADIIFCALAERRRTRQEALKNLAFSSYLQGDIDKAMEHLAPAIAIHPGRAHPVTVLSRIIRNGDDLEKVLAEVKRANNNGFSANSAAQMVRASARAREKATGERIAANAVVNLALTGGPMDSALADAPLPQGQYTSAKGRWVLEHFHQTQEQMGVRFFLMGGTLLGLIRDRKLLAWDKDLDFGCFAEEADIDELWRIFSANPYFLPMGVVDDRLIKLRHVTGVTVDIFVNHREGDHRWHGGQFTFWREPAFELKEAKLGGRRFHVPEDPESYLSMHYGAGWRAPDPLFDVFWEAPDIFRINAEHRYMNTIAKGIQFLSVGARSNLDTRLRRAQEGNAEDVVAGYRFVASLYDDFSRGRQVAAPEQSEAQFAEEDT